MQTSEPAARQPEPITRAHLESRLGALERYAGFEKRIAAVETSLAQGKSGRAWWRSGRWVTAIVLLLGAVFPFAKAVEGHYQNEREEARYQLELLDRIRQNYLDRLFSQSLTAPDKVRLWDLLSSLPYDSVFRAWAVHQHSAAVLDADSLRDRNTGLAVANKILSDSLRLVSQRSYVDATNERATAQLVARLQRELDSVTAERKRVAAALGASSTAEAGLVVNAEFQPWVEIREVGSQDRWNPLGFAPLIRDVRPGQYEVRCTWRHLDRETTRATSVNLQSSSLTVVDCPGLKP